MDCDVSGDKLPRREPCGGSCWHPLGVGGPRDGNCWDEPRLQLKTSHRKSAASSSHFCRLSKAFRWKVGPQKFPDESQLVHDLYMWPKPRTCHVLLHSVLPGSCGSVFHFLALLKLCDTHLFLGPESSSYRPPWESGGMIADRTQTLHIFHFSCCTVGRWQEKDCFLFGCWSPLDDNFRSQTSTSHSVPWSSLPTFWNSCSWYVSNVKHLKGPSPLCFSWLTTSFLTFPSVLGRLTIFPLSSVVWLVDRR